MSELKIAMYANGYENSVGQGKPYIEFAEYFGEPFIVTTANNLLKAVETYDVLLLVGGADILSGTYGLPPGMWAGSASPQYEYLDSNFLMPWLKTGKPIIAICRGMQVLNARMGGTLDNNIIGHVQDPKLPRNAAPQEMYTNFKDYHIVEINSFHHQAVAKVAPGFEVLGWSDRYSNCPSIRNKHMKKAEMFEEFQWTVIGKGKEQKIQKSTSKFLAVPELMQHKNLPYIAFQYHPEELMDDFSLSLVEGVLKKYTNNKPTYVDKIATKAKEVSTASQENSCGL